METDVPAVSGANDAVFGALAAEPRRELVVLLARGDASVGELAAHFDISRPAVSKHLSVLKRAGLVDARSEGRKNVYRLQHDPLEDALEWLIAVEGFWADHLDDIGARVDELERSDHDDCDESR